MKILWAANPVDADEAARRAAVRKLCRRGFPVPSSANWKEIYEAEEAAEARAQAPDSGSSGPEP